MTGTHGEMFRLASNKGLTVMTEWCVIVPGYMTITLGMGIFYLQKSESCMCRGCRVKHQSELLRWLILKTQGIPPPSGLVQYLPFWIPLKNAMFLSIFTEDSQQLPARQSFL